MNFPQSTRITTIFITICIVRIDNTGSSTTIIVMKDENQHATFVYINEHLDILWVGAKNKPTASSTEG